MPSKVAIAARNARLARERKNMDISGKLQELCDIEGFDDPLALAEEGMFGLRAGSPGICMNEECEYTTDVEPDSRTGWCEACYTNTVWSVEELLLEGGV